MMYRFLKHQNYRHGDLAKSILYTGAIAKAGQRAQKKVKAIIQNHLESDENDNSESFDDSDDDVELLENRKESYPERSSSG